MLAEEAEAPVASTIDLEEQARRDAGLEVSDRVFLSVTGPEDVVAAARTHEDLVAAETLSVSVAYAAGETLAVEVTKA